VSKPTVEKRSSLAVLVFILGVVGICSLVGIIQVRKLTCADRPDSIRNPPILTGAEQVAAGIPNFKPEEYYEAREIHYETASKPIEVYDYYYKQLVDKDGWSNNGGYAGYTELPRGV
jgi:hypothetical protein